MQVARLKNYARKLKIKSIIEKPAFVEICFDKAPNIELENMLLAKKQFDNLLKFVPKQNTIQIKITPINKKHIINLCLKVVKVLTGEKLQKMTLKKEEKNNEKI